MQYHNFVYNYGFLADWLNANPDIKRKQLLASMEMSDYNTLKHWIDGETMMPMTQMLKFCNLYSVPVYAFFLDEKADATSPVAPITPDSITEPLGGYPDSTRKAGIKVCDPRTTVHYISCLPEYIPAHGDGSDVRKIASANNTPRTSEPSPCASPCAEHDITHTERMRYLDIIERLSADIIRLTNEKAEHWGSRPYPTPQPDRTISMVAEKGSDPSDR